MAFEYIRTQTVQCFVQINLSDFMIKSAKINFLSG